MKNSLFGWKEKCKLYKFTFIFLVDTFLMKKYILLEKNKYQSSQGKKNKTKCVT